MGLNLFLIVTLSTIGFWAPGPQITYALSGDSLSDRHSTHEVLGRAVYAFGGAERVVQPQKQQTYSREALVRAIEHIVEAHRTLSSAVLSQVARTIYVHIGNPEFMTEQQHREVFYRDLYELISVYGPSRQIDGLTGAVIVGVGLDLLLRQRDTTPLGMYRTLRDTWKEQELQKLTDIAQIVGAKYNLEGDSAAAARAYDCNANLSKLPIVGQNLDRSF